LQFVFESNTIEYMNRGFIKTIRFSEKESRQVEQYLADNSVFDSFSSLARVATLQFIETKKGLDLTVYKEENRSRPPFIWDYDLTDRRVREILSELGLSPDKKFLMERILSQAKFKNVWEYLTVEEIDKYLEELRLEEPLKRHWRYAINRWLKRE
jgi:hypothetical protein